MAMAGGIGDKASLLDAPPRVVSIGLERFAEDLAAQGVAVQHVQWSPPAAGSARLADLLARLESGGAQAGQRIARGNGEVLRRLLGADPVLVDVAPAGDVLADLGSHHILHAGPPLDWGRMCGPLRGAIMGIAVFEGWASDLEDAARKAEAGAFRFEPNHHHAAVGPMTGVTTKSQPLLVVENRAFGNRAYATINEGLGKVLRFGGNDGEVLARLAWLRDAFAPALGRALRQAGGIPLKPIIARGLAMGDEMHQRNVASSCLLLRALAPALARTENDGAALADCLAFLGGNDQFFLNVAMAMAKAIADAARGIDGASIVTAMSRNGTDFGIQVSGLGDTWFTAPAEAPVGLYFPGFTDTDANPDMGDSAIVETVGLGGFAMAAAPAVVGFVGAGAASRADLFTRAMGEITLAASGEWTIPALDGAGVPTGIDIRLVVETGIAPTINTGIAHRFPGIGQVGAGVVKAPMACFKRALVAFAERMGIACR
jgi:hypothetical protein